MAFNSFKRHTLKGHLGQPRAIQSTIGVNDLRAEDADNLRENRLPRLHQLPAQLIGLDDLRAQRAQHSRNGALAAA
jgi:hypothetical protein